MMGQLGDFQMLNVRPTPDLAFLPKIFGSLKDIRIAQYIELETAQNKQPSFCPR